MTNQPLTEQELAASQDQQFVEYVRFVLDQPPLTNPSRFTAGRLIEIADRLLANNRARASRIAELERENAALSAEIVRLRLAMGTWYWSYLELEKDGSSDWSDLREEFRAKIDKHFATYCKQREIEPIPPSDEDE